MRDTGSGDDSDVIVVGAGPAGSTAASYLARAGLDVLLLEKTTFPREKACGDGLTPHCVKQLIDLGVDTSEKAGWKHNRGVRVVTGRRSVEIDWPDLAGFPSYGMVRPRAEFDELLARTAQRHGARLLERTQATGVLTDERTGRVVGVRARSGTAKVPVIYRAPLVLACDGSSARLALSAGVERCRNRPVSVAVRRYYSSPRSKDDYLETHVPLWDISKKIPGYGWIFGTGDGTANVGVGFLSATASQSMGCRSLMRSWLAGLPAEWGLSEDNALGDFVGSALPMGFNRTPHYRDGLLLLGDSGGMVSPFSGEGIGYAMESAKIAAECVSHALTRRCWPSRERVLQRYPTMLDQSFGQYFYCGNMFLRLAMHPRLVEFVTRYGLSMAATRSLGFKVLTGLYDRHAGGMSDRFISRVVRLAPSA